MSQLRIPAVYMRGGTSKGVFFLAGDLPSGREARDRILLRVLGSPDRFGNQIDGMGWDQGTDRAVLEDLLRHWRDQYQWRKVEAANQDDEALPESDNDEERGQSDDRIDLIPRPERRTHEPGREDEDDREGENRRRADGLGANTSDPPRVRGRLQGG